MKKTKYLIIGGSVAAINAAEAIRGADTEGTITIVSDEPCAAYSRPLISYFLGNKVTEDKMYYRDKKFFDENRIELITGIRAAGLDAKNRSVKLENGKTVKFERLLIATGGKPIIPQGVKKGRGVFTFLTWDDAKGIRSYIKKNSASGSAVIVGGGLIGLKAAEGLMELGIKISIVELADRILNATFDRNASGIMENALKKAGCAIMKNDTVKRIRYKGGNVNAVTLTNGKVLKADMVILAIGVVPNIDIVKNTPIKTDRGILTDEHMQTNIKDIYAAGDVAQVYDRILGKTRAIAIWPNASRQGRIAGLNMAGVERSYEGSFAMNSVELCGIPTISMGLTDTPDAGYQVLSELDKDSGSYRKIVLKDNFVVGAIFVGRIDRAGIFAGLIKDRIDTGDFARHFLSDDFGLIHLPKEYRKHLVTGPGIEI
ncbi:NAD(P)/FAD-dependent oxidoreductase [Candidatus Desantisbacteria bacterium CG_4_10_14_0_8_um_filter_48_22]|uniref:NAD(P)/FAD-dependent oxidoreductase n=1 Tax=Candidatus Desantisbacteria bacterium CG_4_10_14_0_8_um_filter_48_22 TaxID=1974543 RepID=A0A2M7S855_9BACT|nr:MAG: hypothetical protein AUJ67_00190 [Candidatus Desantisbacteria bacterium CG1_02_49_89]PIV56799.1 MAG: NAD(P)/FAD-dependent oxidoreductase [Candidatus Desantisbacteria bacterium CG02_land_8_20_14_3_00_49_13]PIZ15687.1 MAG: NAD(P)/FAD-dependent oxidoreductase [Candidatus Desantisbacteria bacterium CG_4_10_14_0_8_um_filter_48_22]